MMVSKGTSDQEKGKNANSKMKEDFTVTPAQLSLPQAFLSYQLFSKLVAGWDEKSGSPFLDSHPS